ncbi:MAG: hypothetical protein SFV51_29930 [Bryobacteraceae bacterium]|nr:hypothetical protein [Bryobacteraceae bacterium]
MLRRTLLSSPILLAQTAPSKRIAAVVTEYRPLSHADVVVGKYLEGYRHDEKPPYPRSKIVALHTEQVPANDLSRQKAKKYGVPIYPTVRAALTLGGDKLAVDGVILIGEHGDYPTNEKGQKLYPRYEMFLKVTDVFRESRRAVPVYTDKHLSWNWHQARRMVEIARELRFPLMAGSSIPVAYRVPTHDVPYGTPVRHGLVISFGGLEGYGFHGLEGLQALMERRAGGETGVAAVQCLEGASCWQYLDQNAWAGKLFAAALARSETRKPGDPRQLVAKPAAFLVHYRDGATGVVFQAPGLVEEWLGAVELAGVADPFSVLFKLQRFGARHHFACLVQNIEKMFETGTPPYPVERTLLTSGILDFALESRSRGHIRLDTPDLAVAYRPARGPCYCQEGW